MFSHMMVGSNDVERSKSFYDALFGKEAHVDDKGRLAYRRKRHRLHGRQADRRPAGHHANGGTIGFNFDSPEEVDAWHRRGVEAGGTSIEDPPGYRENALRQALPRLPARSRRQQALRPSPTGAVSVEIVSENKSHGGRQLVVKHASSATSTDMTFSILPAAAGGKWPQGCRSSGICRA